MANQESICRNESDLGGGHAGPGSGKAAAAPTIEFLGLRFQDLTLREAVDAIMADATHGIRRLVFFINAHCVNIAARDTTYLNLLKGGHLLFADGIGMALAARLWGISLKDNVNGTDLFPLLCANAASSNTPVALLGARPGIAATYAQHRSQQFPGLKIVWTHHGYYSKEDDERILREINQSGARILLVAKGVPMQEHWIAENSHKILVPVLMGVGALFDFYSGAVQRSPLLLRKLRLEWLFRFMNEPRRLFGRYIFGNPAFLFRILMWRVFHKYNTGVPR